MASFIIEGGHPLSGEITPQGAKNEALQIICATLLTKDEVTVENVPDILDVNNLIALLEKMGVEVRRLGKGKYSFCAANPDFDYIRGTDYLKQDVSIDPITVADDDLVKIVAVAQAVDFEGDPGYIFEITNKSDIALYVTNTDGVFTVNGQLIDPTLAETVAPGQTIEGIMFFDRAKLGSSDLSSLVAVEGTIEVWNDDTLDTLGTYKFQA